ncbi:MAG TPA: porin [Caulobacteraceae bacterium]|nr:porin [Caulobacteraceae bacterium]
MGKHATNAIGGAVIAGASWLAMASSAFAADPPPPQDAAAALRAQVAQLIRLVQSLAERDRREIETLTTEVRALQARLDQAEAARTAGQTAALLAAPNPPGHFTGEGARETPASASPETAEPRVVQNETHRFAFESADGRYSIGLTGVVQFDAGAYVGFHPASPFAGPQALSNGVNARRARIGIAGTAMGDFGYAFIYDGGNSSDQTPRGIETAQIIYTGLRGAAFEIGYSNTYFTLDQATSSSDLLFLERATPSNIATNLNAGDFRANAGARFFGDRYWLGGYVTGPASGDSHTQTGERFGAFQRIAVQAVNGPDYSLHLGVGVDELLRAPNSGVGTPDTLTLGDQPELRIDPTALATTGPIGTAANPVTRGYVLDVETAAAWRNLFWQGEYYRYRVDRAGLANADFAGGYGEISWTLTGEHHLYNPQAGAYFRIRPRRPFSLADGGWGAFEVAGRFSYVDLGADFPSGAALSKDPAAIDGGRQRIYSLGLNWYPNDLVRLMLDYSHIDYDKANGTATSGDPLGAAVGATADSVALRVQVAY